MLKYEHCVRIAILLGFCLSIAPAPAQAQLARTFVSAATGNDANDCNRATPCRTFQIAHNKTLPNGEITVLDAGTYGLMNITKSISIVNDGVGEATILATTTDTGIAINGDASTYVNLRGITVQGDGRGGVNGLEYRRGFSLTITNCVFRNLTNSGIVFAPNVAGVHNLSVTDTLTADNGQIGIFVIPLAGGTNVRVAIDRVQAVNNSVGGLRFEGGAATSGTINAAVMNSLAANNGIGIFANGLPGEANAFVTVVRSVIANNRLGGVGGNGAMARVAVGQSTISGQNASWLVTGGATVQSFSDNPVFALDGETNPPAHIARH